MGEKLDLRTAKFHIIGMSEAAPEVGSISERKDTLFIKQVSSTEFEVYASDDKGKVLSVLKHKGIDFVENSFFKKLGISENKFDDAKYTNGGIAINTPKNEGVLTVQMDYLKDYDTYDLEYSSRYGGYIIYGSILSSIFGKSVLVLSNGNRYGFSVGEAQRESISGPMGVVRFIIIEDTSGELDFEGRDRILEGVKFVEDLYFDGRDSLAVFGEGAYQTKIKDNGMLNLSEMGVQYDGNSDIQDFRILLLDYENNVKAFSLNEFKSKISLI